MVIALNEGRVVADVLTSIADAYVEFDKMKAVCRPARRAGIQESIKRLSRIRWYLG